MTVVATAAARLPRGRGLAVGAVSLTVALWASAFVVIRYADRELSPGALALGRLLVGSLALGVLVLVRREPLPRRRELAGIAACGVLWFGVYNVTLNAAETRIDAGTAAMLVNVGPILIAIFAGLILHEGFPSRLFAGCLVSFAGAVVIGVATSRHGLHEILGAVLCLVAAFAYAGGVVAQKPVLRHATPLMVTWLACTIGAVSCLPYAGTLVRQLGHAGSSTIAWTIYLGVAPTAIGFVTWAYALARTTAARWAPQPISCRRWRSCSAGPSSARYHRSWCSRAGCCAWPAWRSPAPAAGGRSCLKLPRARASTRRPRRKGGIPEVFIRGNYG